MFYNCFSLKSLDLSNFYTESSEYMNYMFCNCSSLISLNINNFDTSLVKYMDFIFYGCSSLISLNLKNFDTSNVTSYLNAFDNCNNKLRICINEEKSEQIISQLSNFQNKNCSDDCFNNSENKFIIQKNKCINICSNDDIYRFEFENLCYESCPNKTHISSKNGFLCEEGLYFNENNIHIIINDYITSNNYSNINTYYYTIDNNQEQLKNKNNNLTFIYVPSESLNNIMDFFNLDKNKDKIYMLIIDNLNDNLKNATSNYDYKLILENGTFLNLDNIKENIYFDIYLNLIDLNISNFEYCNYFAKQGYDIYAKNSDFYNDICTPAYLNENDITLKDRKKYIYPNNVTLCKECKDNCEYKSVNIEEQRIICECNLNINSNNSNNDDFLNDEDDENYFSYLLDNINYKIFKCYKLLIYFENIKKSFMFYGILAIIFIIIINYIFFWIFGISNIRKITYKKFPSNKNINKDSSKDLKSIEKENNNILLSNSRNNQFINIERLSFSEERKFSKSLDIKENNNEDIDSLPFKLAIEKDKRNFLQILKSLILKRIELVDLIFGEHKIKALLFFYYIFSLLLDLFFNTLLYSDDVVSNKYHNNGQLDLIVSLSLSLISNIITSIICYYLNFFEGTEERLDDIMEIKIDFFYLYGVQKFINIIKLKVFIFFIIEMFIISFCFDYILIFSIVYNNSQISLLLNYILSLLESLATSIIISIIIVILRKIGIIFLNNRAYNVSKFINERF